eukprot:6248114-Prymnesium_polylepis.1
MFCAVLAPSMRLEEFQNMFCAVLAPSMRLEEFHTRVRIGGHFHPLSTLHPHPFGLYRLGID